MHEHLPSPSPSPLPSSWPASNSSQLWLSPSSTGASSVACSHMTCCGSLDAGSQSSSVCKSLIGESPTGASQRSALSRSAFGSLASRGPHSPHGRLEPLGDEISLCGAFGVVNYVSYPSHSHSDGAISPKLGRPIPSVNPGSPDPATPHGHDGDHAVYGSAATLFPQQPYSQMIKQYSVLRDPPNFGYDSTRAIESYTHYGQGLTDDMMSITGAGLPQERISCIYGGCLSTFTRTADLDRHVLNVHNRVGHHCQAPGCSDNKGNGYCRPDKLKEHMWKKHGLVADLSYTKALPVSFDEFE